MRERRRRNRERLRRAAEQLLSSDGWQRWVRVPSQAGLAWLSLSKQLLVPLARPDATFVVAAALRSRAPCQRACFLRLGARSGRPTSAEAFGADDRAMAAATRYDAYTGSLRTAESRLGRPGGG